jgi:hypothetical protein
LFFRSDESFVVPGLVALQSLDLSHNKIEKLDNKTHGLFDDCLSLERVGGIKFWLEGV